MSPEEIITRLYDLGHFHNPKRRHEVKRSDLKNLRLHDPAVKEAIASFQAYMKPDLDDFAELHHHREAEADGEIGPATDDLFEFPRCGHPDYEMPDEPMGMGGPMESNWPTACRGRLRFGRNFQTLPGSNAQLTHGAMWASANNWTWALEDVDIVAVEPGGSNLHRWAGLGPLSGGTLAWSYLARGTCNTSLEQRYNTRTNWANQVFAATVISHEDGHALGVGHNNDRSALMYPSIHAASQARVGYPNQTDLNMMRSRGYKISENGTTPPPRNRVFLPRPWDKPPPEPEPDEPGGDTDVPQSEYYVRGVQQFVRRSDGKVLLETISVPHLRV